MASYLADSISGRNAVDDAKEKDRQEHADAIVLLACATVHLESGESFELLPFEDPNDVKSKVTDLIGDWSKSGFLIYGSRIYPWHRVRLIEITKVDELSKSESERQMEEWKTRDFAHLQKIFWKTKQSREKKDKDSKDSQEGPPSSHPGAAG
jgi:hypothetical protein